MVIAFIHPFFRLSADIGSSQPDRPGLCTGIYPFLGFDPLVEEYARPTIPIAALYVHLPYPLGNPLVGFCPFRHIKQEGSQMDLQCLADHEHYKGLVTLSKFIAFRPRRSCFIPAMPVGFTLQSFLPDPVP